MRNRRLAATLGVAIALSSATLTVPAAAVDDPFLEVNGVVAFTAAEIAAALTRVNDLITPEERLAVNEYINKVIDETGEMIDVNELEVGTLVDGALSTTIVTPDSGVSIDSVSIARSTEPNSPVEFTVGAVTTAEDTADTSGPGMGTWPDWSTSWHASVRIKVYWKGDYLGSGLFQSFKRKMQNETSPVDFWEVTRRASGSPGRWESAGLPEHPMTVSKLWISQNVTDATSSRTKEWNLPRTQPYSQNDFDNDCSNGTSFTLAKGAFSFTTSNCSDYHVYLGRIGHHRVNMDQGDYSNGGSQAVGYVSSFTVAGGHRPSFTWYQFVTLRHGSGSTEIKCADYDPGVQNSTEEWVCRLPNDPYA